MSDTERREPESLARRARIILAAAQGLENKAIVEHLGVDPNTVGMWRRCIAARRLSDDDITQVVCRTLEATRPDATHWSLRAMARAVGHAPTIHRIWRAFGLQPRRSDPLFVDKVRDIVGLYLAPPERAGVLCVDEKSQMQALERSQPIVPVRPGQTEWRTHDDARHGTTTLFAALDGTTGSVFGRCLPRNRAQEFLAFLRVIEGNVPSDLDLHLVLDNYSTHKTTAVQRLLARHARWHVHFTPTGPSWLNQVDRFFALLTDRQLRRGVYRSTEELEAAIELYIATTCRCRDALAALVALLDNA